MIKGGLTKTAISGKRYDS